MKNRKHIDTKRRMTKELQDINTLQFVQRVGIGS